MVPTKRITSTPLKLLLKNHRLKSSFIKILWKPFNRINSPVYGLLKIDAWKLTEMVKILLVVWVKKRKRMRLRDFFTLKAAGNEESVIQVKLSYFH